MSDVICPESPQTGKRDFKVADAAMADMNLVSIRWTFSLTLNSSTQSYAKRRHGER